MKKILASLLVISYLLTGCSSSGKSEPSASNNSQESSRGPNALGANGLPLLPDEAAEGVCFESFHYFLDTRDPANYDENYNPLYPDAFANKALQVQELWNEIKWMDEKFGTTFTQFALDMGKAAINRLDSYESEKWCEGRSQRVNDGSP